jgi:hypothetical protein
MSKISCNQFLIKIVFFIIPISLASSYAFSQQVTGKQIAQDVMALVAYLELSNMGSRDNECKGTPFEETNINIVIETDIRASLVKFAAMEGRNNLKEIEEIISTLKQIPQVLKDGKSVLQSTYDKAKQDNFTAYGKQSGCASLSASFRTVVQQRKLSIRNFINR